jgi:hypothetical protein
VGKRTTCRVDLVPDLVTAKSLASALAGWTYAKAVAATHCEKDNEEQGMATEHTGFDSVNVKAQMFFEDTDTGKTIKLELPCPSETIFEHSSKNQYTVIKAKGDAIAMDLQVATGRNLRFLKGTKIENRTRPQV